MRGRLNSSASAIANSDLLFLLLIYNKHQPLRGIYAWLLLTATLRTHLLKPWRMLGRGPTRLVLVILIITGLLFFSAHYANVELPTEWKEALKYPSTPNAYYPNPEGDEELLAAESIASMEKIVKSKETKTEPVDKGVIPKIPSAGDAAKLPAHYAYGDPPNTHQWLYSKRGIDRKYFYIDFYGNNAYNPNIIPHRTKNDTFIMVAQQQDHSVENSVWFAEWICEGKFKDNKLQCLSPPSILPIAATIGHNCKDDLAFFGYNVGPHDARVFYGPRAPYAIFGSQSKYACFGMWMQDFRNLMDWGLEVYNYSEDWKMAQELQRPTKYGVIEKNWFVFWDADEKLYVHHDFEPRRVFAKLAVDGSVGPNLAPKAKGDDQCMSRFMPAVAETQESIHQATNALSVTLCKRGECEPNSSNTYIFTIFQHKSYYQFHSNYEPYVMLWANTAPFSIYGISKKPFWFNGRGGPGKAQRPSYIGPEAEWNQTEMNYVVSMAWATRGQTYHGYLDDELFISFGVEDGSTAAIDIEAGDLLTDLNLCSS